MAVLRRSIFVLTLLLAAGSRLLAASSADRAFDAAVQAFHDTVYDRAEAQLADFCRTNPTSPHLSEAILLQAQARIELTNYAGAIELLAANQGKAGTNADQYLFWLGQAYLRKGDWRVASDTFARLTKEFPASSRCLQATFGEASARASLAQAQPAEWPRVIELLQQTNGLFQSAARTNSANELVPQGYLLLSEAQLATKDYHGAEETLRPLAKPLLSPRLAWQWQYLLCRIQLADGRTNAALQGTTNLLAMAVSGSQTNLNLLAEGAAFQAALFERLGRAYEAQALAAYRINLAEGIPADRRRQALLKITELSLAQANIPQATEMLETFLAQYPDAASADFALLTLGELRLREYEAGARTNRVVTAATNAPAATNNLQLAMASFSTMTNRFPQSPLLGKAQLDLGHCYWRDGKLPEAQAAFQAAVEHLPASKDLATAYFRLADTQFQQTNYAGAIKSYQAIIERFAFLPEVRTNLFESALYESVRAGLKGNDLAAATNAMQNLLAWYPGSTNAAYAVLLAAQNISRRGDPAAARQILLDFDKAGPNAPLWPERQLAIAATWENENKWTKAIAQYDACLPAFTNHETQARAEYYRARDTSFQAGRATDALALFTNFVAHYPTSEFTPLARMWVADYYYNKGEFQEAERNYKPLFQNTNLPPGDWVYQAQLMAGRAAVDRQGWKDVKDYLLGVYNNTNAPPNGPSIDLRVEAFFVYGQTLMLWVDPAETNKLANCEEATRVFGRICEAYPTNRLAVRAWGRKAECDLQWALARRQYDSLTNALNAYQRVVDSPQADVAARSEAKVGLAVTLGKWAEQKAGEQQSALLKQALSNCLDVVYYGTFLREGERPDPFWQKRAGMEAFDLADTLQAWSQEVLLHQRLTNNVWPKLPAPLEKRAAKARENLEREKAGR